MADRGRIDEPDFPNRIRAEREVAAFDPAILGPIANIKPSELAA